MWIQEAGEINSRLLMLGTRKNNVYLVKGDRIDLGGDLFFDIYETPGHSRCAISAYAPGPKWLFPSDALCLPIDDAEGFATTASESFVIYLDSLKKLEMLDVALCAWEHFGVMSNENAKDIIDRGIRFTLDVRKRILERLDKTQDPEGIAHALTKDWLNRTGFDFLPYDVMLYVSREMIKNAVEEQIDPRQYL